MFRKFSRGFVIIALIVAVGGHWALLQTLAWTNMLASNLRTSSFREAVGRTFDGAHPCKLCKVISAGKKAEKKTDCPAPAKTLEFVAERQDFIFSSPVHYWEQSERHPLALCRMYPPPLPPPRTS